MCPKNHHHQNFQVQVHPLPSCTSHHSHKQHATNNIFLCTFPPLGIICQYLHPLLPDSLELAKWT